MSNLREMLKRHEGYSSMPYKCPAGKRTIGWGHNIDARPLPKDIEGYLAANSYILPEHAERLLSDDIRMATQDCQRIFLGFDTFSDRRKEALIDMIFNMGAAGVGKFKKMIKAIGNGDWNEAAHQVNDSEYWRELGGDPAGTDDGKLERPEAIAQMLRVG